MRCRLPIAVAVAVLALPGAAQADARQMRKVPIEPPRSAAPEDRGGFLGLFSRKSKRACVDVGRIAGAIVLDVRTIELRMRDGERWRMKFKQDCPALGYYQGFYYRRTLADRLCAGRDAVIARSGGQCPIDSLARKSGPTRR